MHDRPCGVEVPYRLGGADIRGRTLSGGDPAVVPPARATSEPDLVAAVVKAEDGSALKQTLDFWRIERDLRAAKDELAVKAGSRLRIGWPARPAATKAQAV